MATIKKISSFRQGTVTLGDASTAPTFQRVEINTLTGQATNTTTGTDIALTSRADAEVAVTGGVIPATGEFIAEKIWNAVWNDVADFQDLIGPLEFGKCYTDTVEGARISTEKCQMSVIGIASDTYGHAVGVDSTRTQVPIAVCGWALAHVDQEYPIGTPLTNDQNGDLTEMSIEDKMKYPERIVGIYKKLEDREFFGPSHSQIKVNGRHWIKIK